MKRLHVHMSIRDMSIRDLDAATRVVARGESTVHAAAAPAAAGR